MNFSDFLQRVIVEAEESEPEKALSLSADDLADIAMEMSKRGVFTSIDKEAFNPEIAVFLDDKIVGHVTSAGELIIPNEELSTFKCKVQEVLDAILA